MSTITVYSQAPNTVISANGNSSLLAVGDYNELALDINITAKTGTSPTLQLFVDRIDANGIAFNLWTSAQYSSSTTLPQPVSHSFGAGLDGQSFCGTVQLRWALTGTTPTWTYSVSLIGK